MYLSVSLLLSTLLSVSFIPRQVVYLFSCGGAGQLQAYPFHFSRQGRSEGRGVTSPLQFHRSPGVDCHCTEISQAPIFDPIPQGRGIEYSDEPGLSHILGVAVGNELNHFTHIK